jgi:adenylate cyclase
MSAIQRFLSEARRRRVFRVAALYVVGAWILIQVAEQLFQAWAVPDTALRFVWVGALLGLPLAMIFGWRYDLTVHGIVRTPPAMPGETVDLSLRKSDYAILALLTAIAVLVVLGTAERTLQVADQEDSSSGTPEILENSIVVMPFRNISNDPDNDYVSDGLTYELSSYLSRVPEFMVIASGSAFALKDRLLDVREIGRQLRARYLVEGGVRKEGDRLRIDVQLVDSNSGFSVWQQTFDRSLVDILSLQSEVARHVVTQLRTALGSAGATVPPVKLTTVPEAYDYYLLGLHERREMQDKKSIGDWVDRAIDYFQKAIDADPDFAPAYVKLAQAHLVFLWSFRAENFDESMATAHRLVERALILDPKQDDAYTTLAQIYLNEFDFESREHALNRALEINPGNFDAIYSLGDQLWKRNRLSEARDLIREAAIRDPLNVEVIENNADLDAKLGDYELAKSQLLKLIDDHPDAPPLRGLQSLEKAYGNLDQAARWTYQSYQRSPDNYLSQISMLGAADGLGAIDLGERWLTALEHSDGLQSITIRGIHLIATDRSDEAARFVDDLIADRVPPPGSQLQPNHAYLLLFGTFLNAVAGDAEHALDLFERLDEQSRAWTPLESKIETLTTVSMIARDIDRPDIAQMYLRDAGIHVQSIESFGATRYPVFTVARALYQAASGNDERALRLLEQAVDQGYRGFLQLRKHVPLQKYQDMPRFRALLARIDEDIRRQRQRAFDNGWLVEPPQRETEH